MLLVRALPNPSGSGRFTLEVRVSGPGPLSFSVRDLSGRVIRSSSCRVGSGWSTFTADLTAYPKGIYLLEVVSREEHRHIRLIRN
jgi:hypothetical protein